jgi:hypothetical protein
MASSQVRKAVHIPIKFVTVDGQGLPLSNYVAVPTEGLKCLERLAKNARDLIKAHDAAHGDVMESQKVETALADVQPVPIA